MLGCWDIKQKRSLIFFGTPCRWVIYIYFILFFFFLRCTAHIFSQVSVLSIVKIHPVQSNSPVQVRRTKSRFVPRYRVSQKRMCHSFCLISLATNMLEGFILKGGIHSSVSSTKTFLYDIMEPRYKQIKIGYQISKVLNMGQSSVLKSDVQYCFTCISAPLCFTEMGLNLKHRM